MHEDEIAKIVVDCALKVHRALGPGLLETVYQAALAYELQQQGLRIQVERGIPAVYKDVKRELGSRGISEC
jgi:GxxExxY protein